MLFRSKYKHIQSPKRDSDDSSGEETELFVRNKSPKKEIPTKEKTIDESDTLQSLAIRYHCTVSSRVSIQDIQDFIVHSSRMLVANNTILLVTADNI